MDWRLLLASLQHGQCFYCQQVDHSGGACLALTIDHFIPSSKGGDDDISNYVLACSECNRAKSNRMPTEEEYQRHTVQLLELLTFIKVAKSQPLNLHQQLLETTAVSS